MQPIMPWAINAPGDSKTCSACIAGQECREHFEQYWFAEYQYVVPPLVKAYQQMAARVDALEKKLAA